MRRMLLLVCLLAGIASAQPATMASRPCRMDGADCGPLPIQADNGFRLLGTDGSSAAWVDDILWGQTVAGSWGANADIPTPDTDFVYDYPTGLETMANGNVLIPFSYGVNEYTVSEGALVFSRTWGATPSETCIADCTTAGAWNQIHSLGAPKFSYSYGNTFYLVEDPGTGTYYIRVLDVANGTATTITLTDQIFALASDGTDLYGLFANCWIGKIASDGTLTEHQNLALMVTPRGLTFAGGELYAYARDGTGALEVYHVTGEGADMIWNNVGPHSMPAFGGLRSSGNDLYLSYGYQKVGVLSLPGLTFEERATPVTASPMLGTWPGGKIAAFDWDASTPSDVYFMGDATTRSILTIPGLILTNTNHAYTVTVASSDAMDEESWTLRLPTNPGSAGTVLMASATPGVTYWGTPTTLPDQSGNGGKFLSTDGATLSWSAVGGSGTIALSNGMAYSLTAGESGSVITNVGLTALSEARLPGASAGLTYTVCVVAPYPVYLTAASGDTLQVGSDAIPGAGGVSSSSPGSCITVRAIDDTTWLTTAQVGVWSD